MDHFRDDSESADADTESTKFDVYDLLQPRIDALRPFGVSLRYAEREKEVK